MVRHAVLKDGWKVPRRGGIGQARRPILRRLHSARAPVFLVALILANSLSLVSPDTTKYVVLNHGRAAGEMVVIAEPGSTRVRFQYVDRDHQTPRQETRYQFGADDFLAGAEVVRLNLDGTTGDVIERFEARGDSVRW